MVDKSAIYELMPHYIAMLVLVFLVLEVATRVAGELDFWVELVIIIAVVFLYRPAVLALGIAPEVWKSEESPPRQ